MFDRRELKQRAKAMMARSYFKMFIACFVIAMLSGGFSINMQGLQEIDMAQMSNVRVLLVNGIIGLLLVMGVLFSIFLLSPLDVGLKKFMLNTAKGRCNLEDLLYPFKTNYKNIVLTQFMKNLYVFLWSLPVFIPFLLVIPFANHIVNLVEQVKADSMLAALSLMGISAVYILMVLVFSIPAIIKELQYSMVSCILADESDKDWKLAIAESKSMMIGNKWAYVKLSLSFAGWFILAIYFNCGLGIYALLPYIQATFAQLYIDISGQKNDYDTAQAQQNNFFGGFNNF